jgi:hypothetical protein
VITTFQELALHKGIGKSYFAKMLSVIGATKDYEEIWTRISHALELDGVKAGEVFHYKNVWKKLEVERMDPTNLILRDALNQTKEIISTYRQDFREKTLMEIATEVKSKLATFEKALSEDLLTVIIFAELYD